MYPIPVVKRLDFGNILIVKAKRRQDNRMFPKIEGLMTKAGEKEDEDKSSNFGG